MTADNSTIRKKILYSGNVQGVGFRYTTERIARRHSVCGYVRNLPDGRVEVVAEGESTVLQDFIDDLQANMNDFIRDRKTSESPATGEFRGFGIRF
jgi:acylphosphatase